MDLARIDQIARDVMLARYEHEGREYGWLYHHGHRTGRVAQWMAETLATDVDPDLLDHVGPVGPWLAFYWCGAHRETVEDLAAFIRSNENRRHRAGMRAGLNFALARQEFERRTRPRQPRPCTVRRKCD